MPSESADRASERRQATVVFADISGFTAMSERMDPEDVTAVMNGCFRLMESVVRSHGGSVDKYIGDCIMALFGLPNAIENGPARALNAAIEMRRRLDDFNREHGLVVPLRTHIGVNTGLVLAGQVGGDLKRDFTVMGDAVNLASRLKDAAPNGSIYVGPDTYRAARGQFEFHALRPLTLKGKERPVQAFELASASEQIYRPTPARGDRMIFSAIVGRDRELGQLRDAFARVRDGRGGVVSILAEAGIGKSRLMAEAMTAEGTRGLTMLEGRSLSMGESLSYHPFVDLLRHWAGITDDDAEQAAIAKLERAMDRACGAEAATDILPFVATLMGLRLGGAHGERLEGIQGEAMERLILKSMKELLRAIAARQPLVVVFEDLHWADLSSIKLLEALLKLAGDEPILFVDLFRPDCPETADRILARARSEHPETHLELRLEPLTRKQCDELIANLLRIDDLPFSTRALMSSKAEGNPFYIEEVVRSLIDQGAIEHKDGRLRVTEKIEAVVVPGSIQEVIMARVDRLREPARQLLQLASVLGRSFYYRIIAAIHGGADLTDELEYLKERQLLLERASRETAAVRRVTFAAELEYAFKHALVQETIYESILQRTRKELHLKAAEAIESVFADRLVDFYSMLAYHFSRAERLEKAEEYLFKAGDEAARSAASNEALNLFREASRLYFLIHGEGGDPAKKALLEKNIGLALMARGRLPESIEHFDRALGHLGEHVPKTRIAIWSRFGLDLASVLLRLYVGRLGRRTLRATDRDVLQIRFNRAKAQVMSDPQRMFIDTVGTIRRMNQTDPTRIEEACGMYSGAALLFSFSGVSFGISRRMLRIAGNMVRADNVKDEFVYRAMEFLHHHLEGDWDEKYTIDEALVEQDLRYGQLWDVDTYLGLFCERKIHQGDFSAAAKIRDKFAEIADVYGWEFARSNQYAMTAWIFLQRRELARALEAVELYYASRDETLLNLLALGTKAKIQCLLDEPAHAETALRKAEDLMQRALAVPPYYKTFALCSRCMLDLGALERAVASCARDVGALKRKARRSVRALVANARKVAWDRVEAYKLAGRFHWVVGSRHRALRWWARSVAEGARLGARPELARTYVEVARRLSAPAAVPATLAGDDAATCGAKARALFLAMDLRDDLDRLGSLYPSEDRASAAVAGGNPRSA